MEQKGQISENNSISYMEDYYPDTNSGLGSELMPEAAQEEEQLFTLPAASLFSQGPLPGHMWR